jgi:hypothetical protein
MRLHVSTSICRHVPTQRLAQPTHRNLQHLFLPHEAQFSEWNHSIQVDTQSSKPLCRGIRIHIMRTIYALLTFWT